MRYLYSHICSLFIDIYKGALGLGLNPARYLVLFLWIHLGSESCWILHLRIQCGSGSCIWWSSLDGIIHRTFQFYKVQFLCAIAECMAHLNHCLGIRSSVCRTLDLHQNGAS